MADTESTTESNQWWSVAEKVTGSLRVKLTLMFVVVALVPMTVVAFVSIGRASETITRQALETTRALNEAKTAEIEIFLGQFPADLLTFANSPPIQGMFRAVDNGGIDPVSDDSFEVWTDRLTEIFSAAGHQKLIYEQLRYLDETGREVVRVDFKSGDIVRLTGTAGLQDQSDREFFIDARGVPKDTVVVGHLNLNREMDVLEVPYLSVLRYSTPVYDTLGEFRGVVVSNVDASTILSFVEQTEGRSVYLATEDLSFAVHPSPEMLWGSDLGTGIDFNTEFRQELDEFDDASIGHLGGSIVRRNDDRDEIVALGAVHFDLSDENRHWIVATSTPTSTVLAGVRDLGNIVIAVAVTVGAATAILALWLANDLANRVAAVGDAIRRISLGNVSTQISFESKDEVGQLADSYRDMAVYLGDLTSAASRIADGDLDAHVNPTSEDDALGNAFTTMVAGLRKAEQQREAALELEVENRELTRLNVLRNEFLSSVSHELRTPLTSLLAFGDILSRDKEGTLTDRQREQLELIRNNAWKLEGLINDLLDVSQAEAGTFKIERDDLELAQLVRQVTASTQAIFDEKRQTLSVDILDEPLWIFGDEQRITQVLNNLLSNASKYSSDGAKVSVKLAGTVGGVELTVSDDGIGIRKTDIARLFTPFFRVDTEYTRRQGGTGLGLAIVKTIVELHDGTIYVESTLGVGTTMRVSLPVRKPASAMGSSISLD